MRKNNKKLITSLVILLILSIGIVYAYLTSNLSITGSTEIAANSWDIHFANLLVNENSIAATTPATIDTNDDTSITYAVKLNRPKEYYEFTVDMVNDGSLPGKISLVSVTGIESNLLEYSIVYTNNNSEVKVGDILDPSTSKNIKVRLYYKDDIDISDLPSSNNISNITINIEFNQSERLENPINPCTYNGELTQGAEYVNGQYKYRYMQELYTSSTWHNIDADGWGFTLLDKDATGNLTTQMCSSINGKPIVSGRRAFENSHINIDLTKLYTKDMTTMFAMFANTNLSDLDMGILNTDNVTTMRLLFNESTLHNIDFSGFNTSNVVDMYNMFYGVTADNIDLRSIDTSKVTDMRYMFAAANIDYVNLSGLDNLSLNLTEYMFYQFEGNVNLTGFTTPEVTSMSTMFSYSKMSTLDLKSFDTSKVVNMQNMFSNTDISIDLDLSNFNTSNVTDMLHIFGSTKFMTIDLSSFDFDNVSLMSNSGYISNNTNLTNIYVSQQSLNSIRSSGFYNNILYNSSLIGGKGTICSNNITLATAIIDDAPTNPGCFTDVADKP